MCFAQSEQERHQNNTNDVVLGSLVLTFKGEDMSLFTLL